MDGPVQLLSLGTVQESLTLKQWLPQTWRVDGVTTLEAAIAALQARPYHCFCLSAKVTPADLQTLQWQLEQSQWAAPLLILMGDLSVPCHRPASCPLAENQDWAPQSALAAVAGPGVANLVAHLPPGKVVVLPAPRYPEHSLAQENARLARATQDMGESLRQAITVLAEQQQQLRTLQQVANRLNQSLGNLPVLLETVLQAVRQTITDATFSLIGLLEPGHQALKISATSGVEPQCLEHCSSLQGEGSLLYQVFHSHHPQHWIAAIPHEPQDPAVLYGVPIALAQGATLGVLAIGNWHHPFPFDPEACDLLMAFAEQAAIALSNAQLIQALEDREEQLAAQNEMLQRQNEELARQRQQIQHQNLKLTEATQLKSQFLATMSHELRTPINAITGFSQLLLRQRQYPLHSSQVDMLTRILNNGKHLLALINDILDLSKIEAGRMTLHPESFDLKHLVIVTVDELASLAEQKGLVLTIQANLNNPIVINDRGRLRQILVNLLSNAIKFTETGFVALTLTEKGTSHVVITVQDTGIGIAPEHLSPIFQEFWQADQSTSRRYPGTGLGLAICYRLLQLMHGMIKVDSQVGQGTTFWVEIPRTVVKAG